MTEQEKKEIVDVFIVCLVAMACPLLIPVAIMKMSETPTVIEADKDGKE